MPLKKLQEKCKKNWENKITLYSTKSIRTSLNNNKKQINSHQRKSNVPFYMIIDAMISNFNFWIHVMLNSNISLGDLGFIIDVVIHFDLPSYMNILLHHVNIYNVVYHMD